MKRKNFLVGVSAIVATPSLLACATTKDWENRVETYTVEIVEEFVKAGHNDLDRVKTILTEYPNIISARHHWGSGDYEEAIEGASHVVNKEIAQYLLSKGARLNIFTMATLGMESGLIEILSSNPPLINSVGPHGFTLLHNARVGKSAEIESYLLKNGLRETKIDLKSR